MHKPFDLEERMSLNMPSDEEIELLVERCCQEDIITEGTYNSSFDVHAIVCNCMYCLSGPSGGCVAQ